MYSRILLKYWCERAKCRNKKAYKMIVSAIAKRTVHPHKHVKIRINVFLYGEQRSWNNHKCTVYERTIRRRKRFYSYLLSNNYMCVSIICMYCQKKIFILPETQTWYLYKSGFLRYRNVMNVQRWKKRLNGILRLASVANN
jgi:hypothetical protein